MQQANDGLCIGGVGDAFYMLPTDRAMEVVKGASFDTRREMFLIGSRPVSPKALIEQANEILEARGQSLIDYPGVRTRF
jgi:hypothetical protein